MKDYYFRQLINSPDCDPDLKKIWEDASSAGRICKHATILSFFENSLAMNIFVTILSIFENSLEGSVSTA